jgi:hypothetical protein
MSDIYRNIAPLLAERQKKVHPLGCHRQRIPDPQVVQGIF